MPHSVDRRDFILSSLTAAAGASALAASPSAAMEPLPRPDGHHFKLSLAAYSYRELLQANPPQLSLIDFLDDCARFGLDGAELTSYYFPADLNEEYLRRLKGDAFRRGLDVSGTAVRNDFCLPYGDSRDVEIAHVKRWIEYADMMDAPVIRIFAGAAQPGQSFTEASQLAIEGIEECCQHAAKYGVFLALENHGGITFNVDEMLTIVRAVKSPWFGVNMDTGNFYSDDVYGDLAKLAPYSINVQVKVLIKPAGQDVQPTDLSRLASMLKAANYRGYVVLELEKDGDARKECEKYVNELRVAFA
ncbi:MAG: sugar phosphate isomerase/epimerase [Pirellula sp.]|nr:sugar phosphate isomerase/epimerase [Pirellula sp.]